MDFVRGFWSKHRRKVLVTAGCLGSGYFLYKLYNSHTRRLADLQRQLANDREHDENIKAQMKAHFENIQMIVDSTTLPHAMRCLSISIREEIDVSSVMERLNRGKGVLSQSEKLHLWDQLKILSFTRMVLSLWSVTMLSLYIRVQVNILGRHLYVDTARALDTSSHLLYALLVSSPTSTTCSSSSFWLPSKAAAPCTVMFSQEELDLIDRDDEQKFLSSADFLVTNAMPGLILNMQTAVSEVLKGMQLKDVITTRVLQETLLRIVDVFMSSGSPHHWVDYLMMPQDTKLSRTTSGETVSKFNQLMVETRQVLISTEFTDIVEISLKCFTDALVEEMETQSVAGGLATGMPLAKMLPQIEKTIPVIIAEPGKNQFLQLIRDMSEVQVFFTLLYASMPQ
ncbi:BnaCnng64690D [Brassica napus]|uniref:BnaCnng64690D protein n=1 Tax=Brassica napus TaxID=3708 RepID=A0A078JVV5_BRANA|nr:BnaCnng64690D [Brassica napus]